MHNSKFIIFISGCLFLLVSTVRSQSEYLAELGVNGGISYLLDDKNSVPFNNPFLDLGLIYRHNFNERLSAHLAWNNTRNIYFNPLDTIMLNIIDLCGEFNFFDLIKRQYKPKSTNFSPYIFAGAGFAFNQQTSGFNIPFGVGIKYKLGNRFNLNAQWAHRLMLNTDKIEGIESALNGSNFMNKDLVSTFTIGLSYDFWKRPCDCKTKF